MANRAAGVTLEEGTGFWVDGVPAPKGNYRRGRHGGVYDASPGLPAWHKAVVGRAVLWDTGPKWPTHAPMEVLLDFYFERPRFAPNPFPGIADLDNLTKGVLDALVEATLMDNDRQVVRLHASKQWGERSGCGIRMRPLTMALRGVE